MSAQYQPLSSASRSGADSNKSPTNTRYVNQNICALCLKTPWTKLPLEAGPAHPHQPSKAALKVSAKTCKLCKLILRVVAPHTDRPPNKRHDRGFWRDYTQKECIGDGEPRKVMFMRDLGSCYPAHPQDYFEGGGMVFDTNLTGQYHEGEKMFAHDFAALRLGDTTTAATGMLNSEREHIIEAQQLPDVEGLNINDLTDELSVWVYSNYWTYKDFWEPMESVEPKLMGVGVRLSKTASMFESLGCRNNLVYLRGGGIGLCTNDDSQFTTIPGRLRELDSSSDLALQRLRTWLSECSLSHKRCHRPVLSTSLPTRVLDVTFSERSVAVIETRSLRGRYAALSHTWGTSPRLMLTSETKQDLMDEVAVSYLPKTFKDAINLTKKLGIRYLWIDCLCILQDDPEDWQREAATMGQVYRNAYLTISAATSTDSYVGCFPKRTEKRYVSPATISLGYDQARTTDEGALIEFFSAEYPGARTLRLAGSFHFFEEWLPGSTSFRPQRAEIGTFGKEFDPIANAPLSKRGWTLQERYLSPRIVHYAEDQMFYECECGIRSEDGFIFPTNSYNFRALVSKQLIEFEQHGLPTEGTVSFSPGITTSKGTRWMGGWIELVQEYCKRQLTVPDDKLTAVAGLARSMAALTGEKYFAGVWGPHLYEDICWRIYTRQERLEYNETVDRALPMQGAVLGTVKRPSHYRAPSWSWASLDAPINFIPLSYHLLVARVKDIHVTPAGTDEFGRVTDGYIDLEAPLFEVHPYTPKLPFERHGIPVYIDFGDKRAKCTGGAFLDDDGSDLKFPCYALFLDPANALLVRGNGVVPERVRQVGSRASGKFDGRMLDSVTLQDVLSRDPSMKGRSAQGLSQVQRIGLAVFELTEGDKTEDGFPLYENEPRPDAKLELIPDFDPAQVSLKKGADSWGPVNKEDVKVYVTIV